jgi:Tfp pilus assembly protein PilF
LAEVPNKPASAVPPFALWLAAILGLTLLAYSQGFGGPFFFDDEHSIVGNPRLRGFGWLFDPSAPPDAMMFAGRPLVTLSFCVNYALGGLEPWGYHAVNLGIHLAASAVLFLLLRRVFVRLSFASAEAEGLAGAAALLWAVHPINSEAVLYLTQRTELLMGLMYLLTLYAADRAWDAPRVWGPAAVAACWAGMACKEVMVSAPLAVALYDRCVLAPSWADALRRRRWVYAGLAASWGLLATLMLTRPANRTITVEGPVSPAEYLFTQAGVILHYLRLCVWPTGLSVVHDFPIVRSLPAVIPAGSVIVALLAATAWALWKRPAVGWAGSLFFLILAPTSSVVPILTEVSAERRMYLPSAVVVALLTVGAWRLLSSFVAADAATNDRIGVGVTAALACVLAGSTFLRTGDYADEETIWADAVTKAPGNHYAWNNLGRVYERRGALDTAAEMYRQGLRASPGSVTLNRNLCVVLTKTGRFDDAVDAGRRAVAGAPDRAEVLSSLGIALLRRGRAADVAEAESLLRRAADAKPDLVEAQGNLADALLKRGDAAGAVERFRAALAADPDEPNVLNNFALLRATHPDAAIRDGAEAVRLAERAVSLTSGHRPGTLATLAAAYAEAGRFPDAVRTLDRAVEAARRARQDSVAALLAADRALYESGRPKRRLITPPGR